MATDSCNDSNGHLWWTQPSCCSIEELCFQTAVYGYILFRASGFISGGSELLLLVPSVAGLVGSVVLPILGAVPDGMMVLFSGMGQGDVQKEIAVGVGALAGSTVMLLTFPWFIAIFAGAVPIRRGSDGKWKADYKNKEPAPGEAVGVGIDTPIVKSGKAMLMTTVLYLIIQVPASLEEASDNGDSKKEARGESVWALTGLICATIAFFGYIYFCYLQSVEDKELAKVIKSIKDGKINLPTAFHYYALDKNTATNDPGGQTLIEADKKKRFKAILKPFFYQYDRDHNNSINSIELGAMLHDMHADMGDKDWDSFLKQYDKNNDGVLTFEELVDCMYHYFPSYLAERRHSQEYKVKAQSLQTELKDGGDDDEEGEEVPEDLADLSPKEQMRRVIMRSCWLMGIGTFLVLIFSDPMVDVLGEWGKRLNISGFYISFVLAPFASNASELLAAYSYASKKTLGSITTSLSQLEGAACMNNTFVLAIFLALCYLKNIAWEFTAETISIIVVQWLIAGLTLSSSYQSKKKALVILACYPGCLLLVYILELKPFPNLD